MPEHTLHSQDRRQEMTSSEVVGHYSALEEVRIRVWIDGGWAVDALLGRQLRPHKDLDIALERGDVRRLREILATKGYRQVREDGEWNFVLADDEGHEIDVHVFVCDEQGNVVDGIRYPRESLTGTGTIEGLCRPVHPGEARGRVPCALDTQVARQICAGRVGVVRELRY